jgi:NAD-dependent dihydropyrimidine dehydrogenase PreA subunit
MTMGKRTVIEIDEDLCDGCGLCATGCHEGALQIIDGKARMIGESLCDGLGACIGECPRGAITVIEREAEEYDERRVIDHILPNGTATMAAHLKHLRDHGQDTWLAQGVAALKEKGIVIPGFESVPEKKFAPPRQPATAMKPAQAAFAPLGGVRMVNNGMSGGCPGSAARSFGPAASVGSSASASTTAGGCAPVVPGPGATRQAAPASGGLASRLEQWPIQLHLINPRAPYFNGADLLIAADCTAFACGAFHQSLLAGKKLVIACPKLDSGKEIYMDKIRALVEDAGVASITLAIMEVPCCGGLKRILDEALATTTRAVPVSTVVVGIEGGSLTWM